MKSSTEIGSDAEILVQKKLWKFNYKVRRLNKGDYDLIVDDQFKVEVKCAKMTKAGSWAFTFGAKTPRDGLSDIHAFVFVYPDDSKKISYIKTKDLARVMRDNKASWCVSFRNTLENGLVKSPYKVFGYPQGTIK